MNLEATLLTASPALADTAVLVQDVGRRDGPARERFCTLYAPAVELALRRRVRGEGRSDIRARLEQEAEDLVQETMFRACAELEAQAFEYRGPGSLAAWLRRIAHNLLEDRRRHWEASPERPQPLTHTTSASWSAMLQDRARRPVSSAGAREAFALVRAALEYLPEAQQQLVELRFFQGLPWAEVGKELGKTADAARVEFESTVRSRLGLAIAWLRARGTAAEGPRPEELATDGLPAG